jgi:hypothetical protein
LLAPQLWVGSLYGPNHLCPRILHGTDMSMLLRRPDLCWGILRNLCLGILYGLGLRPYPFLGRPALELRQQGFG